MAAEGAVSQFVIPYFARHDIRWLATDRGVLARSGRWGYEAHKPDVLCQPYRALEGDHALSVFFRDTELSDAIGFHYYGYTDYRQAAGSFLQTIKERFARQVSGEADLVLTVVLDGENAWGSYRDDARPFLHALYELLVQDAEIENVTFSEYLDGNPERGVAAHPLDDQTRVYDLFTGSWIDENGSAPGVDLGTWIGESEENQGWELLGRVRNFLKGVGATPESAPAAFEALYTAEGSDCFTASSFFAIFGTLIYNITCTRRCWKVAEQMCYWKQFAIICKRIFRTICAGCFPTENQSQSPCLSSPTFGRWDVVCVEVVAG